MKHNGSDEQAPSEAGVECFSFPCFHDLHAGTFLDGSLPGMPVPVPARLLPPYLP